MTIAVGTTHYSIGASPCIGLGIGWAQQELDTAIQEQVASVVFDDSGRSDLEAMLAGVAETEFEQQQLAEVFASPTAIEDWRVGEAIAEAYLIEHRNCFFPWPDGRDERKSGSSLPGADLVGFGCDETGHCFTFGEVKTSTEATYPPGTLYGRTGLKQQMDDLRDNKKIRDDLMRYLGFRALNSGWLDRYRASCKRYVQNPSDIRIFGVLIRDVDPHQDDVRVRVDKLAQGCPSGTRIELLALYLPKNNISQLSQKALATRRARGDA